MLNSAFELTDHDVLRNRVLVAEQSLAGLHRTSAREEESRQLGRSQMRDLEFAWATFLTRGMEQGAIPQADPRLLARAILGLYNSVWHWYRPRGGSLSIDEIREFYVARCLAVAGLPLEVPAKPKAGRRSARAPRRRRRLWCWARTASMTATCCVQARPAAVLGHRVAAPSTLGTFLRAFTFGHVRQLDRVLGLALGAGVGRRGRPRRSAPGRGCRFLRR